MGADLWVRVASAAALAPLAIAVAYFGGWLFLGFWFAAAVGVGCEWSALTCAGAARRIGVVTLLTLVAVACAVALGRPGWSGLAVVAGAGIAAALAPRASASWAAAGVLYAGALLLAPLVLRADASAGLAALLLLFAVVWSTDVGAYFAGRLIGGPKLWPRVSPKKTWSGALAGVAAAMLAGVLTARAAGFGSLGAVAALCALLSAISQAGDLFESWVKRRFGAKDASQLIPGHGGLMDRLDGFVTAAAAAALIGILRGGWEAPSRGLLIW